MPIPVQAAAAYFIQCVGTDTYLTMRDDGKCTANTKDATKDAQKWYFDVRESNVAIHNKSNGLYLSFASVTAGERTFCGEQTATPKVFEFKVKSGTTDNYFIHVKDTEQVLDVWGGHTPAGRVSGTDVAIYPTWSGPNQTWAVALGTPFAV